MPDFTDENPIAQIAKMLKMSGRIIRLPLLGSANGPRAAVRADQIAFLQPDSVDPNATFITFIGGGGVVVGESVEEVLKKWCGK